MVIKDIYDLITNNTIEELIDKYHMGKNEAKWANQLKTEEILNIHTLIRAIRIYKIIREDELEIEKLRII